MSDSLATQFIEDVSGDVTVSFPAGLIPDDTDPALAAVTNHIGSGYVGSSVTGSFGTYHSHVYRFFKEDPDAGFSLGQFTVTLGSQEAVSGTP